MEPFNIRIKLQGQTTSLTVLPNDKGYYKLIYYAAILGAIEETTEGDWRILSADEIEAGDLPFYVPENGNDRIDITMNHEFTEQVATAIANHLSQAD